MLQIACAADEKYLPHCAAMLVSLLKRNPGADVWFMHSPAMDRKSLQQLGEMVSCFGGQFHPVEIPDAWIEGLPGIRGIPPIMWYRVFLPYILPSVDKVLYLDADTLILDTVDELWETDICHCYVAAVRNVFEKTVKDWPRKMGLDNPEGYFNSGVMLMNLKKMRQDRVPDKLVSLGRAPEQRLNWPDQDALNVVLGKKSRLLEPKWNCQNSFFYLPEATAAFGKEVLSETLHKPRIIHFEGAGIVKPWHYLSKHPYRKMYLQMRGLTPWPDVEFEGRTFLNRVLRVLPTRVTISLLQLIYNVRQKLRKLY